MIEYQLTPPSWIGRGASIKAKSKEDALEIYVKVLKINLDEWFDEVTEDELDDFIDAPQENADE